MEPGAPPVVVTSGSMPSSRTSNHVPSAATIARTMTVMRFARLSMTWSFPPRASRVLYNATASYQRRRGLSMRSHCKKEDAIPRRVDHGERRSRIAEAILRIAATRGLDEVSLRDVAAEAGVSMGQVQHYFATKSEMLRFACAYMVDRTRRAIADALAAAPGPTSARAALRATMIQLLPLDDARRTGVWVWMAFLARGGIDSGVLTAMRDTWIDSHEYIAAQLRWARET